MTRSSHGAAEPGEAVLRLDLFPPANRAGVGGDEIFICAAFIYTNGNCVRYYNILNSNNSPEYDCIAQ